MLIFCTIMSKLFLPLFNIRVYKFVSISQKKVVLQCRMTLLYSFFYKYKNEVGCRDDTIPKTVDTRRHCKEDLPQPPKSKDVGIGLRKIVACFQSFSQCLLVSTVFGMVSSLHPTSLLMIFILVSYA